MCIVPRWPTVHGGSTVGKTSNTTKVSKDLGKLCYELHLRTYQLTWLAVVVRAQPKTRDTVQNLISNRIHDVVFMVL
ncbi:hypothetical protein VN97_g5312 [Penicillium thymicola]|uniref:Uncharacterized protein n=1 Tax=Penicillium thymicola TaxID=293382 RepID=A0AAI9TIX7_PENTH|nr:hypothetical protein VN97_g5312 [Penicillium thymicola]